MWGQQERWKGASQGQPAPRGTAAAPTYELRSRPGSHSSPLSCHLQARTETRGLWVPTIQGGGARGGTGREFGRPERDTSSKRTHSSAHPELTTPAACLGCLAAHGSSSGAARPGRTRGQTRPPCRPGGREAGSRHGDREPCCPVGWVALLSLWFASGLLVWTSGCFSSSFSLRLQGRVRRCELVAVWGQGGAGRRGRRRTQP